MVYQDELDHKISTFKDKYSSFQSFNKRHQRLKKRIENENAKEGTWKLDKKEEGKKK